MKNIVITDQTGSTWRKWDLHIHTPESHLNQDFSGNFDTYFKNLFNAAIDKDISALGPTDYFTIDGYKKIRTYLNDDKKLKAIFDNDAEKIERIKQLLVLPNIELRLNFPVNNNKAVFHIIFSDQVSIRDIEENFLHKLLFINTSDPNDRKNLTTDNLSALGNRLKLRQPSLPGSDLKIAMANIALELADICDILNKAPSIFKDRYLFCTPCYDDVSSVDWNEPVNILRKDLIQKCDFLFAWNPKTLSWAKEISKPCLHGCDAHIDAEICHPCVKRGINGHNCRDNRTDCDLKFCRLKADLTFDGLKQALCDRSLIKIS